MAYKKAKRQFKETVIRSKMQKRQSLSAIEKDPTLSRTLLSRFGPNAHSAAKNGMKSRVSKKDNDGVSQSVPTPHCHSATSKQPTASYDDMAPSQSQQSAMEKEMKLRRAFRGTRHSKGTEELMELMTPSKKIQNTLHLITEE